MKPIIFLDFDGVIVTNNDIQKSVIDNSFPFKLDRDPERRQFYKSLTMINSNLCENVSTLLLM